MPQVCWNESLPVALLLSPSYAQRAPSHPDRVEIGAARVSIDRTLFEARSSSMLPALR
jgi:hypothetical protein